MKLMKVFDISEFSKVFQDYFSTIVSDSGYIEIDLAGSHIPSVFVDELVEKGVFLDEKIFIML